MDLNELPTSSTWKIIGFIKTNSSSESIIILCIKVKTFILLTERINFQSFVSICKFFKLIPYILHIPKKKKLPFLLIFRKFMRNGAFLFLRHVLNRYSFRENCV